MTQLFDYGSTAIFLVLINIIAAFFIIKFLCKIFNISKNLGYLITMGTCICGVTAVIATSSIIKSSKDETSYAVGIVTLFGILAVFFYPYLANYFFNFTPDLAGVFLGTAIHDTAQVSAAGRVSAVNITNNGSSYESNPTVAISAPAAQAFNALTAVSNTAETITLAGAGTWAAEDQATYLVAAGNLSLIHI